MGTVVSLPDAARKMLLCAEPPNATLHAATGLQHNHQAGPDQHQSEASANFSPGKRFACSRNRLVQALSPRRVRRNPGGSGDACATDDVTVPRGIVVTSQATSSPPPPVLPPRHQHQHHRHHQRQQQQQQQPSCGTLGAHHEEESLHAVVTSTTTSTLNEIKYPTSVKEDNITSVLNKQEKCNKTSTSSTDLITELRRDFEITGNELGNLPANIPRPGILTGIMSNDDPVSSPPPPLPRRVASPPGSITGSKDDSTLPCGSGGGGVGGTGSTGTSSTTQQSTATTAVGAAVPPAAHRNGQLAKQGSLTIVRRSSQKNARGQPQSLNSPPPCAPSAPPPLPQSAPDSPGSSSCPEDSVLDTVDLHAENLPPVDTPDACDKAALRLRCLLRQLHRGEVSVDLLRRNLQYAARVLEAVYIDEAKRLADEDDELSEVQPDAVPHEVREWLASTFTRQLANQRRRADEKPKFRSVAHAIRAGIFVDRIYRRMSSAPLMQFPPEVARALKTLDDWTFDVFALNDAATGQPVKYLGYDLLNRYGIIHKFKVQPQTLENFLSRVEEGYCRYRNPYHNNLHAADVAQTVHYMLCQTGLMNWLSDLEIFATLVAAVVHDLEHTGTTNNFHVMAQSDTALLYNDRAVLENHHASATFRLLREEENNILSHLSREEFREFRTLVIDMVLATDMSFHFQQLKNMRNLLTLAEPSVDKSKALSLVLHCCDISHPAKRWDEHHRWTSLLLEEFFLQGDKEQELGLPFSPLCDRNNTLVAESQIGFIEFIVEPSMGVCSDMLEAILAPLHASSGSSVSSSRQSATASSISEETESGEHEESSSTPSTATSPPPFVLRKPWITCLAANKKAWKEQAVKDAEARALQQKKQEEEEEARRLEAGETAGETEDTPVPTEDGTE